MDGMFSQLMSPILNAIYPCQIEEIRNSIQKEKRIIDTLEPLMNQHRLVIDYTAIKNDIQYALSEPKNIYYSLIHQMTHLTKERGSLTHDDRLDALTLAVQYWNEYGVLYQNSDIALEQYKQRQIDNELRRRANIYKQLQGGSGSSKSKRVSTSRLKSFGYS